MRASYRRLPRDRELKISDAQLTETMATKRNPVLELHHYAEFRIMVQLQQGIPAFALCTSAGEGCPP